MEQLSAEAWAALVAAAASSLGPSEAAGPDWARAVAERAAALARAIPQAQEALIAQATEKTFTGRITGVQNPAVSEAGRVLGFAKVEVRSDVGSRPDLLWVDVTHPEGAALAERAQGLVGRRVRFTRRNEPQMRGGEVVVGDDGKPLTRPRLVDVEPAPDDPAPQGRPVAQDRPQPQGAPRPQGAPAPSLGAGAPAVLAAGAGQAPKPGAPPASARELMERAQALGWRPVEVKAVAEELLGPVLAGPDGQPRPRSAQELALLWAELVRRAVSGVGAG